MNPLADGATRIVEDDSMRVGSVAAIQSRLRSAYLDIAKATITDEGQQSDRHRRVVGMVSNLLTTPISA